MQEPVSSSASSRVARRSCSRERPGACSARREAAAWMSRLRRKEDTSPWVRRARSGPRGTAVMRSQATSPSGRSTPSSVSSMRRPSRRARGPGRSPAGTGDPSARISFQCGSSREGGSAPGATRPSRCMASALAWRIRPWPSTSVMAWGNMSRGRAAGLSPEGEPEGSQGDSGIGMDESGRGRGSRRVARGVHGGQGGPVPGAEGGCLPRADRVAAGKGLLLPGRDGLPHPIGRWPRGLKIPPFPGPGPLGQI